MNELSAIFVELMPPDGGMHRLRNTLEIRHDRPASRGWRFAALALTASMFIVAWLLPGIAAQHRHTEQLIQLMHETVTPLDRGLHVVNGAAFELPSSQANVRIFLIQSTP
jgi:hypothetical protein